MSAPDDVVLPTRQHRIDAASAPPVATTGASSVFALGASAGASAPAPATSHLPGVKSRMSSEEYIGHVRKAFEDHAELSLKGLYALDVVSGMAARRALHALLREEVVVEVRRDGREIFYGLRRSGLKGWLERTATGKRSPRPRAPAPAPKVNERTPTPPTHAWTAMLVSSGQVVVEANGVRMPLFADQARAIAAWITKVDAVLDAATEA